MRKILLSGILVYLSIQIASGEPHKCCANDGVIKKYRCPGGEKTKIATLCGDQDAYLLQSDEEEDLFNIDPSDDSLMIVSSINKVPKDEYCLGRHNIDDDIKEIALVCFEKEDERPSMIGYYASAICCIVSTFFLLATLAVYLILPELRDLQGKCLMSSVFSLLMAFIFLATLQIKTNFEKTACVAMASLVYFWFICVFFWLNVVSFNVWRCVVRPKWLIGKKHLFYIYNGYAWGMPLAFLTITLISHHSPGSHIKPNFGHGSCWFAGTGEIWLYFYGPISILLILNTIMFISTAIALWRNIQYYKEQKIRSQKFKFFLYLKLFVIMGICWLFEPISSVVTLRIWIITDYINALQGIFIFLLLMVFRKRVRHGLAKRGICCIKFPQSWKTIKDEECEELEEDVEEASSINIETNNT